MFYRVSDGVAAVARWGRSDMPLYLTDSHEVILGPTLWAADVALRDSKSKETLRKYGGQVARFLQWLEEHDLKGQRVDLDNTTHRVVGAENWQYVNNATVEAFMADLERMYHDIGQPSPDSINDVLARVQDFYSWAREHDFPVYVKLNDTWVTVVTRNGSLLGDSVQTVHALTWKTPEHKQQILARERDKLVDNESLSIAIRLLAKDDPVYAFIAVVIRETALRPLDCAQLPYRGTNLNAGFRWYDENEWLDLWDDAREKYRDISFSFKSKRGKERTIPFPGDVWNTLCQRWMPLRHERALLYKKEHGVIPPNNILFLSKKGVPVTYKMIHTHFAQVATHPDYPRGRFTPYMLRHAFATYFMITALKEKGVLGRMDVFDVAVFDELRMWMGHNNIKTTYQYYLHLASLLANNDDLPYDLRAESTKELRAIVADLDL